MKRLVLISILIIVVCVWLSIADSFLFDFYEQSKAKLWANIAAIPFLIFLLILLIRNHWTWSLKEGRDKVLDTIRNAAGGAAGIWLFYYFLLMPAISGGLLLFNAYVGQQSEVLVTGVVTENTSISMQRAVQHQLHIRTKDGDITLETNSIIVDQYEVGSLFEQTMENGSLGWLTLRKTTHQ